MPGVRAPFYDTPKDERDAIGYYLAGNYALLDSFEIQFFRECEENPNGPNMARMLVRGVEKGDLLIFWFFYDFMLTMKTEAEVWEYLMQISEKIGREPIGACKLIQIDWVLHERACKESPAYAAAWKKDDERRWKKRFPTIPWIPRK